MGGGTDPLYEYKWIASALSIGGDGTSVGGRGQGAGLWEGGGQTGDSEDEAVVKE